MRNCKLFWLWIILCSALYIYSSKKEKDMFNSCLCSEIKLKKIIILSIKSREEAAVDLIVWCNLIMF